ncbi:MULTISPECIES: FAD:protein FMN transferase [Aminobacter]|jgi:thiamine biosynthesis lipoprotein|uniref:FAD:protein FMN transferase n=1 Tax=Aminobacter ciceronei TaxID=150723 RepID=A0ABR6C1R6_9HYPH|nr:MULTISPECIES: FAD:protein FMN transferase [Aminobacter]MBA8905235.1 thiamine biosynthesis lipoprotein [Aminobacter ciceronei]MBA9018903.1 thiamine biosynthesis lipoprotein [Aminobacter ciceronei]MRX32767.1 FAD:protein FMN transferase [Aminobacter sp. MDW-2]QNH34572.1 FAD:protein FMN transferase [Aminobacter sp. MDW-2]
MSKTSTEFVRHALNGPTMGTRWSALFFAPPGFDAEAARKALQTAVNEVDAQMSTWKPDSDLMRLNRAPVGERVPVPAMMMEVLRLALAVGKASDGAFDIGVGDAVSAWGFGPAAAAPGLISTAMTARRVPAHEAIELGDGSVRKHAQLALDLDGIAKGFGVDRLAETLGRLGIRDALVGIDGEMRAMGLRPDGETWTVAVELPDPDRRAPHSVLSLQDCAVATSGDYRHWVEVQGRRLSHTVDPRRGAPLLEAPASVTVLAPSCAAADAWATALMVLGPGKGGELARKVGIDALFLLRGEGDSIDACRVGRVFGDEQLPTGNAEG